MTHQNDTLTPVTSTYRWLAAFCIFMVLIDPASAEEAPPWPQFRGPNTQGVARDAASYPDRLNPARNLLWKTPVPGGMSSPIVAGDRVFVTCRDDIQRLQTRAIDRMTGRLLWRKEAPMDLIEKVDRANSLAASSPASNAASVFVCSDSCGLMSYDLNGRALCQLPTLSMPRGFWFGHFTCDRRRQAFFQWPGEGFVSGHVSGDGWRKLMESGENGQQV